MAANKTRCYTPKLGWELNVLVLNLIKFVNKRLTTAVDHQPYYLTKSYSAYKDDMWYELYNIGNKKAVQMKDCIFSKKDLMCSPSCKSSNLHTMNADL